MGTGKEGMGLSGIALKEPIYRNLTYFAAFHGSSLTEIPLGIIQDYENELDGNQKGSPMMDKLMLFWERRKKIRWLQNRKIHYPSIATVVISSKWNDTKQSTSKRLRNRKNSTDLTEPHPLCKNREENITDRK